MDLGLRIWLPCVCCSSGLSYVLSHLSCWSCVTCHVHFIQLPVEGCHGKDFCTTLRPWKICTRPSGPRKRPEESRETRFTSAILVATSVKSDLCATRGWHMWRHGPLFHLKSCPCYPSRHATRAMARFLSQVGSFWNLAKFADDGSHELRILWDFRCGLLQDLSKGGGHTWSSMWAATIAFHCWLRMDATTCEHKSIRERPESKFAKYEQCCVLLKSCQGTFISPQDLQYCNHILRWKHWRQSLSTCLCQQRQTILIPKADQLSQLLHGQTWGDFFSVDVL